MRTPHTSTRKGKRVRIVMKNGVILIGKFKERTGKYVLIGVSKISGGNLKIRAGDIKSFTIYKPSH